MVVSIPAESGHWRHAGARDAGQTAYLMFSTDVSDFPITSNATLPARKRVILDFPESDTTMADLDFPASMMVGTGSPSAAVASSTVMPLASRSALKLCILRSRAAVSLSSLAIWEAALGLDHPDVATSLENYAALLRETGRADEAAEMEARATAIRAKYE